MRRNGKPPPLQNPAHPGLEQRPYQVISLSIFSSCKRTSSTFNSSLFPPLPFYDALQAHESQPLLNIVNLCRPTEVNQQIRVRKAWLQPSQGGQQGQDRCQGGKNHNRSSFHPTLCLKKLPPLKLMITSTNTQKCKHILSKRQWIIWPFDPLQKCELVCRLKRSISRNVKLSFPAAAAAIAIEIFSWLFENCRKVAPSSQCPPLPLNNWIRDAPNKKKRDFLGIFPKCRTPPSPPFGKNFPKIPFFFGWRH